MPRVEERSERHARGGEGERAPPGSRSGVRAVAAALKFRGHPDLLNTDIRTMQNYWLKITGDSEMHTRNVKPHMINGQGRWRLHAQDPPEMVFCIQILPEQAPGEAGDLQLLIPCLAFACRSGH